MIGKNVVRLKEVDSTNDYVKRENLSPGTVVIAQMQTKGKGRRGRVWHDDGSGNVMMSVLFEDGIENVWKYPFYAAAAVFLTLKELGIKAKIKWPNDIYVNDKKIAGILVETIIKGGLKAVVLGMGINVNQKEDADFDYISINDVLSDVLMTDVEVILIRKLNELQFDLKSSKNMFLDICRVESYLVNKKVIVENEIYDYVGIGDRGELVVKSDKEYKFNSSEVSIMKIMN